MHKLIVSQKISIAAKCISEGKSCMWLMEDISREKKAHCYSTDNWKWKQTHEGEKSNSNNKKNEMKWIFPFVKWTHATFNDIDSYGNRSIERYEIENLMNTQASGLILQFAANFFSPCVSYSNRNRIKVIDKSAKYFGKESEKKTTTEICELQRYQKRIGNSLISIYLMLWWTLKWHKP